MSNASNDDDVWCGSEIEIRVASNGTLWLADFDEPKTRAEVYEEARDDFSAPHGFDCALSSCPPLASFLCSHGEELRADLEARLAAAQAAGAAGEADAVLLRRRLDAMPEDFESGLVEWLDDMDEADFCRDIAPAVDAWFAAPPNWAMEDDYIPASATAQGAAMRFFEVNFDPDVLAELGVEIVEGDHPFSSYCAAVLRRSVDEANEAARRGGHGVWFVAAGA